MVDQLNRDGEFARNYLEKLARQSNDGVPMPAPFVEFARSVINNALSFKFPPEVAKKDLSTRLDYYIAGNDLDSKEENIINDFKASTLNPTAAVRNERDLNIPVPSFASTAQAPDGESQLDQIKKVPDKAMAGIGDGVGNAGMGLAALTNAGADAAARVVNGVVGAVKAPFVGLKNMATVAATGAVTAAHAVTLPKLRKEMAEKRVAEGAKEFDNETIKTALQEPVKNDKSIRELTDLGEAVKKATTAPERAAASDKFLEKAEEIMKEKGEQATVDARNSIDPNFKGKIKPGEDDIADRSDKLGADVSKVLNDVANSPELAGDPNAERINKAAKMLQELMDSIKKMVASIFKSFSSGPDNKASAGPRPG